MRFLFAALPAVLPQAAAAFSMGGPGMGPGAPGGGMVSGALMGAVAVLGWWLLTKVRGEADKALLWSGRVLGWVLLVGGLSGFLCASLSHAGRAWKACSSCGMHGPSGAAGEAPLPPGHPPLGGQPQP